MPALLSVSGTLITRLPDAFDVKILVCIKHTNVKHRLLSYTKIPTRVVTMAVVAEWMDEVATSSKPTASIKTTSTTSILALVYNTIRPPISCQRLLKLLATIAAKDTKPGNAFNKYIHVCLCHVANDVNKCSGYEDNARAKDLGPEANNSHIFQNVKVNCRS